MYTTLAFAIVGAWFMVASTVALATDLEGDPERGKILFGANGSCAGCHSLVPRRIRVGPSLASLFGRKAGVPTELSYLLHGAKDHRYRM